MFHKDGPSTYDSRQFDERGCIRLNAPSDTERTTALPPGDSKSALFAFFTRTFLGLKPNLHHRVMPEDGLRLRANIGTAIIFFFDSEHQVAGFLRVFERESTFA